MTSSPPNCGKTSAGALTGCDDRALVDLAVGGERLGRRGRPDGQLDLGRVRAAARRRRRPGSAPCPADAAATGKRTSTRSLAGTVTRRPAPSVSSAFVGAHGDVDVERRVGLVLHDDGQLEAVAEVEEARRRRPHHQRQPRRDRRLARRRTACRPRPRRPSRDSASGCRAPSPSPRRAPCASVGTDGAKTASALKFSRMRIACCSAPRPLAGRRSARSPLLADGALPSRAAGDGGGGGAPSRAIAALGRRRRRRPRPPVRRAARALPCAERLAASGSASCTFSRRW